MAAYSTLIDGSKWFAYGNERRQNVVDPKQWQAMMNLCKFNGHISVYPLHKEFGRKKEFPPDLNPYFIAEHSLRLLQLVEQDEKTSKVKRNWQELKLEALIFDCHKVYPPGDKYSPELSEKGQNNFDRLHIKKNRKLIKRNSIIVRRSLGLSKEVSSYLIDLNRQLQSDELFYLQDKSDEELKLMGLSPHGTVLDLKTNEPKDRIYPLSSEELTKLWWSKFIDLDGWSKFDEMKKKNQVKYGFEYDDDDDYESDDE